MEQKLSDAELMYRTVADFTYDWEYWRAPDGHMLYCSPSCERITGYRSSDFRDRPELLDAIVLPEDQTVWEQHSRKVGISFERAHCQFRIREKAGHIRWIDHVCLPVYDDKGSYLGVRASNREITKYKETEREVREYRDALALLDRTATMGQLAGSIAHELNQPLTGILSNAQAGEMLLSRGDTGTDELKEIFSDIVSDGKRAANVLQNLRNLYSSRKTEFRVLKVHRQVEQVLRILNSEMVIHNIRTSRHMSGSRPRVMGNEVQIQQVLINLIRNAMQSMESGGIVDRSIAIIETIRDGREVLIRVEDNGPGIDPEIAESMFEPMVTSKPKGLGMGLSICRTIVQAYDGRIWAENISDGGARVVFTLPVYREDA
jgi:PAS domain S-box-containing protein